jgi:hypothetical protein
MLYYLYSTHYMFRPQMGHLQVLQVSHILLPNCNVNIPIFINGSYKLVPEDDPFEVETCSACYINKVLLR